MDKGKDSILSDLSSRFIHRHLFKYMSFNSEEELNQVYQVFYDIYTKYQIQAEYYLKGTISKEAYQYYNEHVLHHNPILLYYNNELVEIAEVSHIVRGIKDVGAKTDYKLYYAKNGSIQWMRRIKHS